MDADAELDGTGCGIRIRDGKMGIADRLQPALRPGCPVAIEVFDGNTGDPTTLAPQIDKLKQRFGLNHVVLVGDAA